MLLAIDIGNTRLKWALYDRIDVSARLLAEAAEHLEFPVDSVDRRKLGHHGRRLHLARRKVRREHSRGRQGGSDRKGNTLDGAHRLNSP